MCQSHTGHMTGLWFLPTRSLRQNTNEWLNTVLNCKLRVIKIHCRCALVLQGSTPYTTFCMQFFFNRQVQLKLSIVICKFYVDNFGHHCELKQGFLPGKHFVAKGQLARLFPCPQGKISDGQAYTTYCNKSECCIFHTTTTSKFGHRTVKKYRATASLVF